MKLVDLLNILCFCYLVTIGNCLSNKKLLKESKRGRNNIIKLTNNNYKEILQGPLDSYIVVFLTATQDSIGCTLCQTMEEEYDILTESWFATHPDGLNLQNLDEDTAASLNASEVKKGVFFAKADYSDGDNSVVFQHFQAQQVPLMYVFTPTEDGSAQSLNTFQAINVPATAQAGDPRIQMLITSFKHYFGLENYTIHKPINWGSRIITVLASLVFLFVVNRFKKFVLKFVFSRILWALVSCLFITIMCNGYMFNKIRKTQYAGQTNSGEIIYFEHGMQTQYGIETQIVTFLYGTLGLLVLFLARFVPSIATYYDQQKKHYNAALIYMVSAAVFLFLIFFFSSALMYVFRMKYPNYPFKLLK